MSASLFSHAIKIDSYLFMGMSVIIETFPGDTILWVSDFSTEYLVYGIDKRTGDVLYRLALKGNGPLEMHPPVHLFFDHNGLCLYDRNRHKIFHFSADSIISSDYSVYYKKADLF